MNILIEPVIDGKEHGKALQASKFSLALKLTNIEDSPSAEFNIISVSFSSAENVNITNDCNRKSFIIRQLNPSESVVIEIGDFGHPSHGLISISLLANSQAGSITFSQKDPFTSHISTLALRNSWNDFIYIESLSDSNQKRSNSIMVKLNIVLTFLAAIQIVKLFEKEILSILKQFNSQGSEIIANIVTLLISLGLTLLLTEFFKRNFK